jgi:hypothetical protein
MDDDAASLILMQITYSKQLVIVLYWCQAFEVGRRPISLPASRLPGQADHQTLSVSEVRKFLESAPLDFMPR